jgi:2-(1,2-epoxy-1,2-dihydrophenyl)acetyl-CoA isomerase
VVAAEHGVTAAAVALALYPALASGSRDALDALLSDDFVGDTEPGLPLGLGGHYEGPTAMRREFWGALGRAFDVQARPDTVTELDGKVLVEGTYVGTARSTGKPFEAPFTHSLTVRDGRITALIQRTVAKAWTDALLEVLTLTTEDGLAHVHLTRPEVANAIDVRMARDLRTASEAIKADVSVRAVLLTGEGDRFCAGGEIGLFSGTPHQDLPGLLAGMISDYHVALRTLAELPVPVVSGVQGAAAGGGLGLLWASDLVVAGEDAKLAVGYAAIGLSADGGSTWYLPRLIGPVRAAQLFFENRVLSAAEALDLGLVWVVVPADQVASRATEVAPRLAHGPTLAFATVRRLLRGAWDSTLPEALDAERSSIVTVAATRDASEGLQAFASHRQPAFTGE